MNTQSGVQTSNLDKIPSPSNTQEKTHPCYSLDDSPSWETHWRRGERATKMALEMGVITEDQVED